MKFNVWDIIVRHFISMTSSNSRLYAFVDTLVIFVLPAVCGVVAAITVKKIDPSFYGVSISVFAVFAALLLNTQVAIFGIYGRIHRAPDNQKERNSFQIRIQLRNKLIKELNVNVSYLMLISVVSLFLCSLFYVSDFSMEFEAFFVSFLYIHFSITVIIVIKRAHALFANEYNNESDNSTD